MSRMNRSKKQAPLSDLILKFQFLQACCQVEHTRDDITFISSYLESSALENLPIYAMQHGLLPLLYTSLKKIIETHHLFTATSLLETLKKYYLFYVQNNMLMTTQLLQTMKLLEENGYQALSFKGPSLAIKAYGDITLRQYVDLDILVKEEDAFEVATLLKRDGATSEQNLSLLTKSTCLNSAKDFSLFKNQVHTELHWRLFEKKYNIPLVQCVSKVACQTVVINQQSIYTLEDETLLVYLCLHGAKHTFERLEWVCDIDRFIRNTNIDWHHAFSIATQAHSKRAFLLGLSLSKTLFHTPLPQFVEQEKVGQSIEELQHFVLERLTNTKSSPSSFKRNYEIFRFQSKLFDSKKQAILFNLSTFFKISTTDCQTFNLPNNLKFLYFPLRPLRLITRYLSNLFR